MSLILCRQEPVNHPFYFEELGVRIFSSQELCYVIYHNPLLVRNQFVNQRLIDFIQADLDMTHLAAKLVNMQQSEEEDEELLVTILQECDYYRGTEINQFRQKLVSYKHMTEANYLKEKGDFLFEGRQYGKAVYEYQKILELKKGNHGEAAFMAKVYNNLGACYGRLFMMEKAYRSFIKSFELVKNQEVLKRIYHLLQWSPSLKPKDCVTSLMTEALKQECEIEREKAEGMAQKAESLKKLDELFQKDSIRRLEGAGELIQKWKQEYRNIMS
ncbi:hypothetical protein [Clostridium sp. E02]|uniref:hypothetical protein n=1 Tax=Clostridium sp. E02 TaxID=2487134 RepID=UPI000F52ADFE|nr:hypothetical protein [Clostridium sp. E02]